MFIEVTISFHKKCLGCQGHSTRMPIVVVEVVVAIDMEPMIIVVEPDKIGRASCRERV